MVRRLLGQVSHEVSNKLAEYQKGLVFVTEDVNPPWSLMDDGIICVEVLNLEIPLGRWISLFRLLRPPPEHVPPICREQRRDYHQCDGKVSIVG